MEQSLMSSLSALYANLIFLLSHKDVQKWRQNQKNVIVVNWGNIYTKWQICKSKINQTMIQSNILGLCIMEFPSQYTSIVSSAAFIFVSHTFNYSFLPSFETRTISMPNGVHSIRCRTNILSFHTFIFFTVLMIPARLLSLLLLTDLKTFLLRSLH